MRKPDIDLSAAVTVTPSRVIGMNGKRPWRLPSEISRIKGITLRSGVIVVGRTAYEIFREEGLLRERKVIVLTRKNHVEQTDSLRVAASVEDAILMIEQFGGRACMLGGAQLFSQLLPFVRTLHITTVYAPADSPIHGDAHFPKTHAHLWARRDVSAKRKWYPDDEYPTTFETLELVAN